MKKIVFIAFLVISFIANAQQKHEAKLDIFDLAAFKAIDVTYQYILNEESAAGVSIFKSLADKDNIFGYREEFSITPFYRQYFPLGAVENVFVEAFFAINSGVKTIGVLDVITNENVDTDFKYTNGAFGLAGGKSFISPRGFVLDVYIGLGRNLFNNQYSPNLVPRIGVNAGYRF